MSMKNVQDIVDRLKDLQRYRCTTTWYDDPDMEEDEKYGDWVRQSALQNIIDELEEDL